MAAPRRPARPARPAAAKPQAAPTAAPRPATDEEFQRLLATIAENTARYQHVITEAGPEQLVKPLHEMSNTEFRAHAAETWNQVAAAHESPARVRRPPMTTSDYIAGGAAR
ncbi:hypothetical protein [Streptacidiphilus albus]|uniref:hypothetical protein n=1 Tax=Streptacidiphilus albus TaxID=105425 RepID=UPI00054C4748|nr:hypothetical protein [Streptacidiphilus albus]